MALADLSPEQLELLKAEVIKAEKRLSTLSEEEKQEIIRRGQEIGKKENES